jgi:hypothetical protein
MRCFAVFRRLFYGLLEKLARMGKKYAVRRKRAV